MYFQIQKYSQFINFPIYLWSEKTVKEEVPIEEGEEETKDEEADTEEKAEDADEEEEAEVRPQQLNL